MLTKLQKNQIVTKLKKSKCDNTQKLKMSQNLRCDKTQKQNKNIKLKNSKYEEEEKYIPNIMETVLVLTSDNFGASTLMFAVIDSKLRI